MKKIKNITVIGNGLSALCTTLFLLNEGISVTLLTQYSANIDTRTTAILQPGIDMLCQCNTLFSQLGTPLKTMHIADYTAKHLPAIDVFFHAKEINLDSFARNIDNEILKKTYFILFLNTTQSQ